MAFRRAIGGAAAVALAAILAAALSVCSPGEPAPDAAAGDAELAELCAAGAMAAAKADGGSAALGAAEPAGVSGGIAPAAGAAAVDIGGGVAMGMARIAPGSFAMGQSLGMPGAPERQAAPARGFYIGAHPVTQDQFYAVMGANPSHFSGSPAG